MASFCLHIIALRSTDKGFAKVSDLVDGIMEEKTALIAITELTDGNRKKLLCSSHIRVPDEPSTDKCGKPRSGVHFTGLAVRESRRQDPRYELITTQLGFDDHLENNKFYFPSVGVALRGGSNHWFRLIAAKVPGANATRDNRDAQRRQLLTDAHEQHKKDLSDPNYVGFILAGDFNLNQGSKTKGFTQVGLDKALGYASNVRDGWTLVHEWTDDVTLENALLDVSNHKHVPRVHLRFIRGALDEALFKVIQLKGQGNSKRTIAKKLGFTTAQLEAHIKVAALKAEAVSNKEIANALGFRAGHETRDICNYLKRNSQNLSTRDKNLHQLYKDRCQSKLV